MFQLGTKYSERARRALHRRRRRRSTRWSWVATASACRASSPRSSRSTTTSTGSRGPMRSRRTTCTSSRSRQGRHRGDSPWRGRRALRRSCGRAGVAVLYDDRDASPGVKFADADLVGMPVQLIVGAKGLARGVVERNRRATGEQRRAPTRRRRGGGRRAGRLTPWRSPVTPPVSPDAGEAELASSPSATTGLRAEVGRFPLHRVPRRRRRGAREPQRAAAHPLLPRDRRAAAGRAARRAVVDGELVDHRPITDSTSTCSRSGSIPRRAGSHMLAEETPASFVAFDLLADRRRRPARTTVRGAPRRALEAMLATRAAPVYLTPVDHRPRGRGDSGSTASRAPGSTASSPSVSTARTSRASGRWLKVKHLRTADCVVAGYRRAQGRRGRRVAAARAVRRRRRPAPRRRREQLCCAVPRASSPTTSHPCEPDALDDHPWAGVGGCAEAQSGAGACRAAARWNAKKDMSWEPLRIERVAEVAYEHLQRSGDSECGGGGSGTRRASSAGAPTATPRRAPTSSSTSPCPSSSRPLPSSSGRAGGASESSGGTTRGSWRPSLAPVRERCERRPGGPGRRRRGPRAHDFF